MRETGWIVTVLLLTISILACAPMVEIRNWALHPAGMVRIPAGLVTTTFHDTQVYVPEFYMDVHEVTQADFSRFVQQSRYVPSQMWNPDAPAELAVCRVTHDDAEAYAHFYGKHLPSSAEWDAAFGPDIYPWGDKAAPDAANVASRNLAPPASYPLDRSPFGVYDLAGGLSEWTRHEVASGNGPPAYVIRGGCWLFIPRWARRATMTVSRGATYGVGFRCVWP